MEYVIIINILSCKYILMFPGISFQWISGGYCQTSISIGMYHPLSDRLDVVIGSQVEKFRITQMKSNYSFRNSGYSDMYNS